jgi:hypothetical protein
VHSKRPINTTSRSLHSPVDLLRSSTDSVGMTVGLNDRPGRKFTTTYDCHPAPPKTYLPDITKKLSSRPEYCDWLHRSQCGVEGPAFRICYERSSSQPLPLHCESFDEAIHFNYGRIPSNRSVLTPVITATNVTTKYSATLAIASVVRTLRKSSVIFHFPQA